MSTDICYCGIAAGYPHRPECPRPLYRATPAEEIRWESERQQRLAAIYQGDTRDATCDEYLERLGAQYMPEAV